MRIAVLSDIHGNLLALEAVIKDICGQSPDLIVNLGDSLSGPLWPSECADRLISEGWPTIQGNHERQLLSLTLDEMGTTDRYTHSCLLPAHFEWIAKQPKSLVPFENVLMVHGTPQSDLTYCLETVQPNGIVRSASLNEIEVRIAVLPYEVMLCGHSHLPRVVQLVNGPLVLNPGSVGLPAYEDIQPHPHRIESGSPHARYGLLENRKGRWSCSLHTVSYNHQQAAERARSLNRLDWSKALATGWI